MLSILITILIMCLIFGLLWWVISLIPMPAPFGQVVRVVCALIFVIWLIYLLLPMAGGLGHPYPLR